MAAKILGQLRGIICSAAEASRNHRKYTERFWDSIFNSDMFQEGIENKMFFGELWHPEDDYEQIHPGNRSAVVLSKVEKDGLNYYGTFDILPTESGKVLKDLVDVGCVFGASSRGLNDYDTDTFDDPSAYSLITFDIVAFPGIKSARLNPVKATVSESFSFDYRRKAMADLNSISKSNPIAKVYISETLKKLEENRVINTNVIFVDKDNKVKYNGIYGIFEVEEVYKNSHGVLKQNDKYIVSDIVFDSKSKKYLVLDSDWVKLN